MSPLSQKKCKLYYRQYERTNSIRKLARYEDSKLELNKEQNEEMCGIMEEDQHGVGSIMKKIIWITHKHHQNSEFSCDQICNR